MSAQQRARMVASPEIEGNLISKGQSLIEVTVGIVCAVPIILVMLDLAVILFAVQQNDSTCRNAARAAAAGSPQEATFRAQGVVDQANKSASGRLVSNYCLLLPIELQVVQETGKTRDPATGKYVSVGGPVQGHVGITTQVDVRPFVVYLVYGGHLPMRFQSRQRFPISYIAPVASD